MHILRNLLFFIILCALAQACRVNDHKEWDVNAIAPIGQGTLTIADLIKDSSTLKTTSDKSIILVKTQELTSIKLSDYIKVPDTSLKKSVNFKTINLGQRLLQKSITLGEIAKKAGFTGAIILLNNHKKMVVPALSNLSTGQNNIDAQNFFQSATFIDGKLRMEIYNQLPVNVTDVHYQLRNASNQAVVIDDTINSIVAHGLFSREYSLAGKTVEGKLVADILSMNSPGSNGDSVLIDTSNAIILKITAHDMVVQSADAVFPAQDLVNEKIDITYALGGPLLTYMHIQKGDIRITAKHTIQDSLHINYAIPKASLNGVSLALNRTVPPAPAGDSAEISEIYKVDNYSIDLTGMHRDTFNTFYNILVARIDSSGKIHHLSLKDSIYIFYGLFNVVPDYVRGYLGKQDFSAKSTSSFPVLDKVLSGTIHLPQLKTQLELVNSVGAEAKGIINSIKAVNSKTGKSVALEGSVLNSPIKINPARDNPLTPSSTVIELNSTNSNISKLLEIIPDQFQYDIKVTMNPNGNTSNFNDFLYSNSAIEARLNIELPMNVGIDGLVLQDTIDIPKTVQTNNVQGVQVNLYLDNGFPLGAEAQLYNLGIVKNLCDSFLAAGKNSVLPAQIDPNTAIVLYPTSSQVQANMTIQQWAGLVYDGKMIVRLKLNTIPVGKTIKIYDDYKIKVKATAKFTYRTGT